MFILKAVIINILATIDQMTICNVKERGCVSLTNPKRCITKLCNFPQIYGALWHLLAQCFGFTAHDFMILVHSHQQKHFEKASICNLPNTKQ